jgi:hypothetical protein
MQGSICRTDLSWPLGVGPLERAVNAAPRAWGARRVLDLNLTPTTA